MAQRVTFYIDVCNGGTVLLLFFRLDSMMIMNCQRPL
jgi:hypothetical protein